VGCCQRRASRPDLRRVGRGGQYLQRPDHYTAKERSRHHQCVRFSAIRSKILSGNVSSGSCSSSSDSVLGSSSSSSMSNTCIIICMS